MKVRRLTTRWSGAQPVCLGYDPSPLGLNEENTGIKVFQFFNLDGLWQLTFIVYMPEWGVPDFASLED